MVIRPSTAHRPVTSSPSIITTRPLWMSRMPVRFRVTWKRTGILLIHSGLVVMMLGELVTGLWAVEGRMTIPTGEAAGYTEDYHAAELAVVDRSNPRTDDVVVVPSSMLQKARKGDLIHDDQLPFDVQVERYLVNSGEPRDASREGNPATAGVGLEVETP